MKTSELEKLLKEYRKQYGDVNVCFNRADDTEGGYEDCTVDIAPGFTELTITVI